MSTHDSRIISRIHKVTNCTAMVTFPDGHGADGESEGENAGETNSRQTGQG